MALSIVLALVLVSLSANFQYREHAFCGGGMGAGYPWPWVCEAGAGGSPISSWDRIDFADVYLGGLNAVGFLADFIVCLALVWGSWLLASRVRNKAADLREIMGPAAGGLAFMAGLTCALMAALPGFLINDFSPRGAPTAFVPAATAGPSTQGREAFDSLTGRHVSLGAGEWLIGGAAYFSEDRQGCGTSNRAEDRPYIMFLMQGPVEVDVKIEDGSWEYWVNLYDWNAAMQALEARVEEWKQSPGHGTSGYVECILTPGG
jgi:hypothetical protein